MIISYRVSGNSYCTGADPGFGAGGGGGGGGEGL